MYYSENARIKIQLAKIVTINERYELFENGTIRYNRFADQNTAGNSHIKVKIENNQDQWRIRLKKWNSFYVFDVYSRGVILQDPMLQYVQFEPSTSEEVTRNENQAPKSDAGNKNTDENNERFF